MTSEPFSSLGTENSVLASHFEWLKQAGFINIDCYWKQLFYAVLGAQKPTA